MKPENTEDKIQDEINATLVRVIEDLECKTPGECVFGYGDITNFTINYEVACKDKPGLCNQIYFDPEGKDVFYKERRVSILPEEYRIKMLNRYGMPEEEFEKMKEKYKDYVLPYEREENKDET